MDHDLTADDIRNALDASWGRNAAPGRKNRPRHWKWFYEVLRNAFIPGYAARLSEAATATEGAALSADEFDCITGAIEIDS
jgi:hypothetical protein